MDVDFEKPGLLMITLDMLNTKEIDWFNSATKMAQKGRVREIGERPVNDKATQVREQ